MTKDEAYEKQRRERIALERENKKLKALVWSRNTIISYKVKHTYTLYFNIHILVSYLNFFYAYYR